MAVTEASLFGAEPGTDRISPTGANAIVMLTDDLAGTERLTCTGTLIAPRRVLTARHCEPATVGPAATVLAGADAARPAWRRRPGQWLAHPELDLALVDLVRPVGSEQATPLRPLLEDRDIVGSRALLAGYGRSEDGELGVRRFVEEPVVDATDQWLWVDGMGASGACEGDSGGPLLLPSPNGTPVMAGVLSVGEPDCRSLDGYQRLATAASAEWLLVELADEPEQRPCEQ